MTEPTSERAGLAADGLSTVLRLQKDFEMASEESDRALRILSRMPNRSYGLALQHRAQLLGDQGNFAGAVDYSERALTILRDAMKDDPAGLASIVDENRRFHAARGR
jgi:hypothetical protein